MRFTATLLATLAILELSTIDRFNTYFGYFIPTLLLALMLSLTGEAQENSTAQDSWASATLRSGLKSLVIAPSSAYSEIESLSQRIEMTAEWLVPESVATGKGISWEQRAIEQLARRHDVVILSALTSDALPEIVLEALAEKVRAGCGLVLIRFGDQGERTLQRLVKDLQQVDIAPVITRGLGHRAVSTMSDLESGIRGYIAEGIRVLDLQYQAEPPPFQCLFPIPRALPEVSDVFRESYYGLLVRALQWAAQSQPRNRIIKVEGARPVAPNPNEVPPFLPSEFVDGIFRDSKERRLSHFSILLDAPAVRDYHVAVRAQYPHKRLPSASLVLDRLLKKGERTYTLQVPLSRGEFFVDFALVARSEVIDRYRHETHEVGWPMIRDFECLRTVLLPNDTAEMRLTIAASVTSPRPSGVLARATDSLGRVVAEKRVNVNSEGGRVTVKLDFVDLLAGYVQIEVFAFDGTDSSDTTYALTHADYASLYLPVRHPAKARFRFVADGLDSLDNIARLLNTRLRDVGVDTLATGASTTNGLGPYLDRLEIIPTVASYEAKVLSGWERAPCLSDDIYLEGHDSHIRQRSQSFWAYSPPAYHLTEDAQLAPDGEEVCRSFSCVTHFQDWLRATYRDPGQLQRSWKWPLKSFNAASRFVPDASYEGNAALIDLQRYMDGVFESALLRGARAVREVDRQAKVGFRVKTFRDLPGTDWENLAGRFDSITIPSDRSAMAVVRSFQSRTAEHMVSISSERLTVPMGRWLPWAAALNGFAGVWLDDAYKKSTEQSAEVALTKNGEISEGMQALSESVAVVKNGVAEMLRRASRLPPSVAIYLSRPSALLARLNPEMQATPNEAISVFTALLDSSGYSYDVVSSGQVTKGALDDYAVVILPMLRAVSDDEVEALRRFSARGGTIIADLIPGEYDEHGAARVYMPLTQELGVDRNGNPGASAYRQATDEDWSGTMLGTQAVSRGSTATRVIDGEKSWFVYDADERQTVVLDHTVVGLEQNTDLRDALASWIEMAGVKKIGADLFEKELEFEGQRFVYQYAGATLFAIVAPPDGDAVKVLVQFKRDVPVYDVLAQEEVLRGRARIRLEPGQTALYAIMPYEVGALTLETPPSVRAGRRLGAHIGIQALGSITGTHLTRVTLRPKNGNVLHYYSRNIECVGGQGDFYLPLALNEIKGAYVLEARDLLTGMSDSVEVQIVQ